MEYHELREQIMQGYHESNPQDLVCSTNDLEYIYDTEKLMPALIDRKKGLPPLYLNHYANQQFCTRIGIPNPYIERCPPSLKETNCNHFLRAKEQNFKFRVINQRTIRAVLTESYTPIDDYEFIDLIEPFVRNHNMQIISHYKSEVMTSIRATYREGTKETHVVGDIVKKGIVFNNSEVGYMAIQFRAFLYRLVCSNGMIAPKSIGGFHFRHRGDKNRIMTQSQIATDHLDNQLDVFWNKFESARQIPVAEPYKMIEDTVKGQKWPQKWSNEFSNAYNREPNESLFGVINALTRGCQPFSLHSRVMVEEHAASVLESGVRG